MRSIRQFLKDVYCWKKTPCKNQTCTVLCCLHPSVLSSVHLCRIFRTWSPFQYLGPPTSDSCYVSVQYYFKFTILLTPSTVVFISDLTTQGYSQHSSFHRPLSYFETSETYIHREKCMLNVLIIPGCQTKKIDSSTKLNKEILDLHHQELVLIESITLQR